MAQSTNTLELASVEPAPSGDQGTSAEGAWHIDPVSGNHVRVAPARADRPNDYAGDGSTERRCPFCAGSEADTPDETDRIDDADGAWLTRVVPNEFPAVVGNAGAQEVVIESPRHTQRFIDLTPDEATAAVTVWARRLTYWRHEGRFDYTLVFKNEAPAAGASLQHTHSQVLALPEAPERAALLWQALRTQVFEEHATWSDGPWRVVTPNAQRFAYEAWIRPMADAPSIAELANGQGADRLAWCLQQVITAVIGLSNQPAYNLIIQVPPVSLASDFAGQWWIEVVPRGSVMAGLELATGLWVNAVPPKQSAARLAQKLGELD